MARNEYPCGIATDVEIMIYDSQHDRRGKGITTAKPELEERRHKKRFVVSTLAQYRWQDSSGTWFSDRGMTLNISVAGVFVLTTSSPPTGAAIEMKVAVPGPGFVTGRGCLFGKGVVVRVSSEGGFAAQVDLRMLRVKRSEESPSV